MANDFVAIDVETANADIASICQVGMVAFADGKAFGKWASLVNPEDEFDGMNVAIHGIDQAAVRDAPKYPDIVGGLRQRLEGAVVVTHMAFDRAAVERVHAKYSLPPITCTWLDSARVTRRAWPEFSARGYALESIADFCEIDYQRHNAMEDARAAGEVVIRAVLKTGVSVTEWVQRSRVSLHPELDRVARVGNPDGPLAGEVIVFTGALVVPRREAAALAAKVGCDVAEGVTKKTTLLVVGDQDVRRLSGGEKSSKHRKAEQLISAGHRLRILRETDFLALVELD